VTVPSGGKRERGRNFDKFRSGEKEAKSLTWGPSHGAEPVTVPSGGQRESGRNFDKFRSGENETRA
jgi:hypothetical protein